MSIHLLFILSITLFVPRELKEKRTKFEFFETKSKGLPFQRHMSAEFA